MIPRKRFQPFVTVEWNVWAFGVAVIVDPDDWSVGLSVGPFSVGFKGSR